MDDATDNETAIAIAARVEAFVRGVVASFEHDSRWGCHGPSTELVHELRSSAAAAGVLSRGEMIVRSSKPQDLEMPLDGFVPWITPVDHPLIRA